MSVYTKKTCIGVARDSIMYFSPANHHLLGEDKYAGLSFRMLAFRGANSMFFCHQKLPQEQVPS